MNYNVAVKALDFFNKNRDHKENSITFFGGEPLIEKDLLFKIADNIIENYPDIEMHVTTNGTLLSKNVYNGLKKRNIHIMLSLDGYGEKQDYYRKYGDGRGSWNDIIQNLYNINMDKLPPVRMTVTTDNVTDLSSNVLKLYNMGFRSISFYIAYEGNWDENKINLYEQEYKKIALFYQECYDKSQYIYIDSINKMIKNNIYNIKQQCGMGNRSISVLTDGSLYPCHRIDFDKKDHMIGDVYNGVKTDACQFYQHILELVDPECSECIFRNRCLKCPMQNKKFTGEYHLAPDILCRINQIHIVNADKIAAHLYNLNNSMFMKEFYMK